MNMDKENEADAISSLASEIKELKNRLGKLENQKRPALKDIHNKLSSYAQNAIDGSKGPLQSSALIKLCTDDVLGKRKKETLAVIRKSSSNIEEVKMQISLIVQDIQENVEYRKKQNESDYKLIRRFTKLNKIIEEEIKKDQESNQPKIQSTLDEFFGPESPKINNGNVQKSANADKYSIRVKRPGKRGMERKYTGDDESASSQETELEQVTYQFRKRLKVNPSPITINPRSDSESMTEEEIGMQ